MAAAPSLHSPPPDQSYLQQPAGSLVLLLLGQHMGAHQGHILVVQEVLAELAVQHSRDQWLHLDRIILEVSAQRGSENHQLFQGWASAPTAPQQLQEALHPMLGYTL